MAHNTLNLQVLTSLLGTNDQSTVNGNGVMELGQKRDECRVLYVDEKNLTFSVHSKSSLFFDIHIAIFLV